MMFRWLSRTLSALAAVSLALAAPLQANAVGGHPAMWKLSDADTTIYLFGTIHVLPKEQTWRTAAFDAALARAGELVLEVPNIDDPNAMAQALFRMGAAQNLPPLAERLPEEKRPALAAMLAEAGLPDGSLDTLKTWMASLVLMQITLKRLGLDSSSGVELTITGPFKASGKPVKGLETIEQQFGYFDNLSEESQRKFLADVLDSDKDMQKELTAMLAAWAKGDVAGVAATFDDETQLSPELRQVLMTGRNARWAEWIKARMEQPGTVFIAVGAGHLAGKDSVESMLEAKGLKVERVQ